MTSKAGLPWPSCAHEECHLPALFKLEFVENGNQIWLHVCPLHILEIKACLDEVAALRIEQRKEQALLEGPPPEEDARIA